MKKIALRTDESRFADLPDYPFVAHYLPIQHADYETLRMHYISEGSVSEGSVSEGEQNTSSLTLLLLHGCPTWSYLYRKVITALQQSNHSAGIRMIAPDFIGCGKSDKLLQRSDYSYEFYVDSLRQFIKQLDLCNIFLVCQDWGGPIGLRVLSEMPERFAAVIASNTLLPNCEAPPRGVANWPGSIIEQWVNYTQKASDANISQLVQGVCTTRLPAPVLAAYDAPFPDARYKQGMLGWPSLIPLTEKAAGIKENRQAWQWLENSKIPFATAFSDSDPSTADWEKVFQQRVPGAANHSHEKILDAGHMVQEDKGEELAAVIKKFLITIR